MALDSRFVVTADLQGYFVNKDTGLPLSGGTVTFYEDENRTTLKLVYELTGTPPNYTYTPLPNPLTLSSVGTYMDDSNNDVVPYYFPYDGTPTESTGTVQLYYVVVRDANGVEQLTREGWPNASEDGSQTDPNFVNLAYNGQFLSHTDIVGTETPQVVTIGANDYQYVAQGGYVFRRSNGGASVFENSFTRISTAVAGLDDFPRFGFNFVLSSYSATDSVRDFGKMFRGVNTLSSGNPPGDSAYTLYFAAESLNASSYTYDIRLIRYYGTGGSPSPEEDTSIGSVTITPSYTYYTIPIADIPVATGTLGENNDDFMLIALRAPESSAQIQITDFCFFDGNVTPNYYPHTPNDETFSRAVAGWMPMPNPDGSDLYLSLVLTSKGMVFDDSVIGRVETLDNLTNFSGSENTETNLVLADGSSYVTSEYSLLGVPWARLQARYWDSVENIPIHGTGIAFVTVNNPAPSALIRMSTNNDGAQTATSDISTGFTFTLVANGTTAYNVYCYISADSTYSNVLYIASDSVGSETTANGAGTSGFTFETLINKDASYHVSRVTVNALPAAGSYFLITTPSGNYYVWFTLNGAGADPAPGGTGILCPLLTTYNTDDVTQLIREVLSGYQVYNIETVAASSMSAGDYFEFYSNSQKYVAWYSIDGAGTEPAVSAINIEVELSSSDSADNVALATMIAVNSYQFAVPDLSGVILRNAIYNTDRYYPNYQVNVENRFSLINKRGNNNYLVGTYEFPQNLEHSHETAPIETVADEIGTSVGFLLAERLTDGPFEVTVLPGGGIESRPFNYTVAPVIRY